MLPILALLTWLECMCFKTNSVFDTMVSKISLFGDDATNRLLFANDLITISVKVVSA